MALRNGVSLKLLIKRNWIQGRILDPVKHLRQSIQERTK